MKKHGRAIIILLSLLMVCATACGGESSIAPTVGYIPQGWETLLETEGFANCALDYSCTGCGMLQVTGSYTKCNGSCHVAIIYCPIPESYRSLYENNSALMKHELEFRWNASELTNAAPMTIDGQAALSMERCNDAICWINVACIKDSTILDILAFWDDPDNYADIMAVINSIQF